MNVYTVVVVYYFETFGEMGLHFVFQNYNLFFLKI